MPSRSRPVRKLSVVANALTGGGWIAGTAAISATASLTDESTTNQIVLGSPNYAGKYGRGWGEVKPKGIDNGGVPSGRVATATGSRLFEPLSRTPDGRMVQVAAHDRELYTWSIWAGRRS
jgi:hypothetical protein